MSGLGNHGYPVRDPGRWIPGKPSAPLSPRCGKPMLRYEAANGPMLDQPHCGRPEGHKGMCRSTVALARQHAADVARIAAVRAAEGWRYSRSAAELGRAA